jgi:polyisoprenoid-binding protein YceI
MMKRAALVVALLAAAVAARAAGPASYTADPAASRLEFITAAIDFAPDALASARFDVQIDLNSLDTMDKDRDQTIRGPDLFDIAHHPTAHYVTRSFTKTATGYSAVGALTLRGVTKDVPIDFQFTSTAGQPKIEGTAKLKRLEFGVGQGDWKSTAEVKDEVKVAFSLVLKPGA